MAEKRKHSSSICVKIDAKTLFKIELFPAEQWAETAQAPETPAERFRLRINRRWHDVPGGGHVYLDAAQIAALAASLAAGQETAIAPEPDIPHGASVYFTYEYRGETRAARGRTGTTPIRGHDGQVYIGVHAPKAGFLFLPVENFTVIETASQARRLARELNARQERLLDQWKARHGEDFSTSCGLTENLCGGSNGS
jgi:hypothetical protein